MYRADRSRLDHCATRLHPGPRRHRIHLPLHPDLRGVGAEQDVCDVGEHGVEIEMLHERDDVVGVDRAERHAETEVGQPTPHSVRRRRQVTDLQELHLTHLVQQPGHA